MLERGSYMKKIITALVLGWSGVALAQTSQSIPPQRETSQAASFNRDDPYIVCAKSHPQDRARYSNCDLKGVWHSTGMNPS